MKNLQERYEKIANAYIKKFVEKQSIEFDFWIDDEVGTIAGFNGYDCFDFNDIRFDIDTNQPDRLILDWVEYCLNNQSTDLTYRQYVKSLRPEHVKKLEREKELIESKQRLESAKEIFYNEMENYNKDKK